MKALKIDLFLLQPLLVTQSGSGEENSATAQDFIPGSAIRGAVIQRYLQPPSLKNAAKSESTGDENTPQPKPAKKENIAQSEKGRRLFFDGTVCYLNGYLVWPDGERMLPKPLSWRVAKDDLEKDTFDIHDFTQDPLPELSNPSAPSGVFARVKAGAAGLASPRRFIQVHNASNQRSVKKSGDSFVFRYDALAQGQRFQAVIISESQTDLEEIQKLLDGQVLILGGSRSAEYGQARVVKTEIKIDWHESPPVEVDSAQTVTITLLSDAIARGQDGQPRIDLTPVFEKKHKTAFTKTRIAGGFNRQWGLPLAQIQTIQAGSVFVYEPGQLDPQQLTALQEHGLGERRVEGYGRIAVNWARAPKLTCDSSAHETALEQAEEKAAEAPTLPMSEEGAWLLKKTDERRLRMALDHRLAEALACLSIRGEIHNAQLSRIRQAALEAGRAKDLKKITKHLEGLKSARSQFERARVEDRLEFERPQVKGQSPKIKRWSLFDWLTQDLWAEYLQPQEDAGLIDAPAELQVEYVSRLLDGLFRKTNRANQEEGIQ